jgi:hypothetical protein
MLDQCTDKPIFIALAGDPEAGKIKEWRHQLQRAFLRDQVKPEAKVGLDFRYE